jgi:hypothetical protein
LAATLKLLVPGPEPLAPEVIVIQAVLLMATQVQPALAVMVTRATCFRHGLTRRSASKRARYAGVTVNVLPPAMIVPVRSPCSRSS